MNVGLIFRSIGGLPTGLWLCVNFHTNELANCHLFMSGQILVNGAQNLVCNFSENKLTGTVSPNLPGLISCLDSTLS